MLRQRQKSKSNRVLFPREESSYRNMLTRCYNPKATGYNFYGGRGITVCDRWRDSFENFYSDMGPRPEGMSLDRKDVNGNYTPENCRWATNKEQGNNTSSQHYIEYNGEKLTISLWAEKLGILQNTIYYRLARGWTVEEAFEIVPRTPPWMHKLSREQISYLVSQVNAGRSQVDLGKEVGLHSSQVSRLYRRYK